MYSKVNYAIVGLFVLLFGAGLVWFAFWLAKYGMKSEFKTYKLLMKESVSGLSKDSVVRLHGVDVGRVSEIRIDPDNIERIEVLLKIKSDIPIKKDMVAHTQMLGVTGLLSIEIDGGTNNSEILKSTDDNIPIIKTDASWFSKTKNGLGNLSQNLMELTQKMQILLSKKNLTSVDKILQNTEKFTAKISNVEEKILSTLDDVNITLSEYRAGMANIDNSFEKGVNDFHAIKEVSVPVLTQLMKTTKNFNRTTLKIERSIMRGDYNFKKILEPTLLEINILSEQINSLSKELNQSPSDLLFKSRKHRRGPGE